MAGFGITRQYVLHDGTSANSSVRTTNSYWCGDADFLSVSIATGAAVASTFTLQGANVDGFLSAISEGDWSNLSVVQAQGAYAVAAGFRWLRCLLPSVDSRSTVLLEARST